VKQFHRQRQSQLIRVSINQSITTVITTTENCRSDTLIKQFSSLSTHPQPAGYKFHEIQDPLEHFLQNKQNQFKCVTVPEDKLYGQPV